MQTTATKVVVLGTGGTIAGTAPSAVDTIGYASAQLGIRQLMAAVPELGGPVWAARLEAEQLAQVDSKDMDFAVWLRLVRRIAFHLERPEVAGVVVTHGTDTLEETAYFLHRVLASAKPVVLTAAMRPATALQADGPQNLLDAVRLCGAGADHDVHGVLVVFGGEVFGAGDVRKVHPYRLAAFSAGDAGVLARIEQGRVRRLRPWPEVPAGIGIGIGRLPADVARWPRVEIVHSHVNAGASLVRALCADGIDGIVAACTGNGSLHHVLEAALLGAQRQGVRVLRSSRCLDGAVIDAAAVDASAARTDGSVGGVATGRPPGARPDHLPSAGALTPVKARIELMLQLMGTTAGRRRRPRGRRQPAPARRLRRPSA